MNRRKLAGKVIRIKDSYEFTIFNSEDKQEYYIVMTNPVHICIGQRIGFWAEVVADNCAIVGGKKQPYFVDQIEAVGWGLVKP